MKKTQKNKLKKNAQRNVSEIVVRKSQNNRAERARPKQRANAQFRHHHLELARRRAEYVVFVRNHAALPPHVHRKETRIDGGARGDTVVKDRELGASHVGAAAVTKVNVCNARDGMMS